MVAGDKSGVRGSSGRYDSVFAAAADTACAFAYWGQAYALGPNYNLTWDLMDPAGRANALSRAYDATARAVEHADAAGEVEAALIP